MKNSFILAFFLYNLNFVQCKFCGQSEDERIECGWINIDSTNCENLGCCFDAGKSIPCFLQTGQ